MKNRTFFKLIFSVSLTLAWVFGSAQTVPELIYYKFDGTGTSVPNQASAPVGSNPASINTHTQGGTGQFGTGLQGGGSGEVNSGWNTSLTGDWTMSFYVNFGSASSTFQYIFGDGGAGGFRIFANGAAGTGNIILRGPISQVTATGVADGNPHVVHYVYSTTTGDIRSYVDGVLNTTVSQSTLSITGGSGLQVGGYSGSSSDLQSGAIMDEFRLYNRALDQTEITLVWNQSLPLSSAKNDAGVTKIDSPSVFCEGTRNIVATVRNFGINQIDSVTVNWTFNGALQAPVVATNILLDTFGGIGSQTALITLGSKMFTGGKRDTIEAWTSLPNNQTDTVTDNDSAYAERQPAIAGTFTIDPTGTGSTNYASFTSAAQDLADFGVCGPVIFKVAAGTYNEQVMLDKIEGASSTNTIMFEPDTGAVTIEFVPTSSDNYVVNFAGATWVTFKDMTIQTGPGTGTYGHVIEFSSGGSNNTVYNCEINGLANSTTTSNLNAVIYANAVGLNNNRIWHNDINGGSYGIYYRGAGTGARNEGVEFIGNNVEDPYYYGTYFWYNTNLKVNENRIRTSNNYIFGYYGLYSQYAYNASEFIGNDIDWPNRYGFFSGNMNGTVDEFGIVANNMIQSGDSTGFGYGMYVYGGLTKVVYNTIYQRTGTNNGFYGIYIPGGGAMSVFNNLLYTPNGSGSYYALYYTSSFGVIESDHNAVWAPNMQFGRFVSSTYSDLAAWQSGTSMDQNSIVTNPDFTQFDPMRTCNDTLDGAATPVTWVSTDFDGDQRDPMNPDIGADEWIGNDPSSFSAGDDKVICEGKTAIAGQEVTGGSYVWYEVNSPNDTLSVTSTYEAESPGTYVIDALTNCGTSHSDTVVVYDRTPTATFTSDISFRTGKFTNTSLQGDSYRWIVFTDPADTIWTTDLTYVFPDNGPYNVQLTTYNDCDTVSSDIYEWFSPVGINETALAGEISLMPNPVSDVLTIEFGELDLENMRIEMTNIQGQVVYSQNLVNDSQTSRRNIDVSQMRKGMYLLTFITDSDITTKRIIVQ